MDLVPSSPIPSSDSSSVTASDQIALSETDRSRLQIFVHSGQHSTRARTRAEVLLNLLKLSKGWSLAGARRAFDECRHTVIAVRARCADGGVDAVVRHKRQAR